MSITSAGGQDEILFANPAVVCRQLSADVQLLTSPLALEPYPDSLSHHLSRWAKAIPLETFLAERISEQWVTLSYQDCWAQIQQLAGWLIERATLDRPLAILSDNSIEHALLMLAAMHIGVPAMPISPAYSLMSKDFGKLRSIIKRTPPGVIYVTDCAKYQNALRAIEGLHQADLLIGRRSADAPSPAMSFDAVLSEGSARSKQQMVSAAFGQVTPDTVAKLLFTSGSTDEPKAVINTQRMLCSNQQAKAQLWPFLYVHRPIIVDWLPWHHTFGGNHNFNMVLRNGGTLYIDDGRPTQALFQRTIRNLLEIAPTLYFNVPRGFELLVPALKADEVLRKQFFSRLKLIFYAAASLPKHLWEELNGLARFATGRTLPMVTSWGATETAPLATDCYYQADRPGVIGLPIPGCTIKLVTQGTKLEARVAGPHVTPGYWRRPDLTATHFDEEGFYRSGDAFCFADKNNVTAGLVFDGRLSEDFKLMTGTWVSAGSLRLRVVTALAPLALDVVVTGHDRSEVGLLIFPNWQACAELCRKTHSGATLAEIIAHPALRAEIVRRLAALKTAYPASSMHATRALILPDMPSIDFGEITDKGYLNQRRALTLRHPYVLQLYQSNDSPSVLLIE